METNKILGAVILALLLAAVFSKVADMAIHPEFPDELAYKIERIDLGIVGGAQDQYAATFGGINFIEFFPKDVVIVNPLRIKKWVIDELEASIVLYFTGLKRSANQIEKEKKIISSNPCIRKIFCLKNREKEKAFLECKWGQIFILSPFKVYSGAQIIVYPPIS